MNKRFYFFDNLRTFLIFIVVLYHAQFPYTHSLESIWLVSDLMKSDSLGMVGLYLDLFVMYTLFFIAGFFTPMSLQNKTNREFVLSKLKRIMVPWTIGVLTLIPAYKAIYLFSRGKPQEEWFSYFHWFERAGGNPYLFSDNLSQNWLWFLPVLFLFQLIYAVIIGRKNPTVFNLKTGTAFVFIAGVITSLLISANGLSGWHDSILFHFQRERILIYFMVFLLGALCYNQRLLQGETQNKKRFIWMNVLLTFSLTVYTVLALNLFFNMAYPDRNYFFFSGTIDLTLYYGFQLVSMLTFIYILVDYFRFKMNKTNRWLKRLNDNSYYVYIIHLVVSGLIAVLLMKTSLPVGVKYLVKSKKFCKMVQVVTVF